MRLVLLGTNGFEPTDEGQTACYMIPELGIVLDAGSGAYRIGDYLQTSSLDIYLTHSHWDHTSGLLHLFGTIFRNKAIARGRDITVDDIEVIWSSSAEFVSGVRVHGSPETLTEAKENPALRDRSWQWCELNVEHELPENGVLLRFPLDHTISCVGFRLEWPGHSMAYVTDTTAAPDSAYIDSIRGVDLLLHDSYLPDSLAGGATQTGHSNTSRVAEVARAAGVNRLVLIHHNTIGMRTDEAELDIARAIFSTTQVGFDGMELYF